MLSGQDTAGSFSIVEHPLQSGTLGAAPRVHLNEDEYSFVLEGEVGGTDRRARIYGYRGNLRLEALGHTSHLLERGSAARKDRREYFSSRFEKHFDEIGEVVWAAAGGEPNFAKLTEIADRYGLTMYMERVPALLEKYNLRLG